MHYLGVFATKQEAIVAYEQAVSEWKFGDDEAQEEWKGGGGGDGNFNTGEANSTGFMGVHAQHDKWVAQIHCGGQRHYLGRFDTKEQAARAYDVAVKERRGVATQLNFPDEESGSSGKSEDEIGVYPNAHGSRWQARIMHEGRKHSSKEEASEAYDSAARGFRGTTAKCNFRSSPGERKRNGGNSTPNTKQQVKQFKSDVMRKGKWTPEEEIYTRELIHHFEIGILPHVVEGTCLRVHLSEQLNCDPMRITKKVKCFLDFKYHRYRYVWSCIVIIICCFCCYGSFLQARQRISTARHTDFQMIIK